MRVLHVIGPLRTGGAQTQLLGLVRAAHGKLWDATVVATSGGTLAPEFAALGCPFEELRRIGSPGLLRMRRLRQIVADGEFDVVHGNLWQSNMYCRVAVAGRRKRPAVVISERNVEARRSALRRSIDRVLAPVTDAYVGNTDAVAEFIHDVHPTRGREVVTIPNAVDHNVFHATRRPASTRSRRLRVGAIGRLDHEKGFHVLIEATRRLTPVLDLEVCIVGEGALEEELRTQANGLPIAFVGPLSPGIEVARFLRSLDVFVLPSTYREGRPNAILEAVATEIPVVTTAIPGIEELFNAKALIPPGDATALADAIRSAALSPASWIEATAPVQVDTFDTLGHRYAEVFERAIHRSR